MFAVYLWLLGGGRLADDAYFRQVQIHPLLPDTVMWLEEQDIAPLELHALSTTVE